MEYSLGVPAHMEIPLSFDLLMHLILGSLLLTLKQFNIYYIFQTQISQRLNNPSGQKSIPDLLVRVLPVPAIIPLRHLHVLDRVLDLKSKT